MNEYTRLVRPEQSQVQIEPTAQDAQSDGFNYPTFRMLNKQGRVNISPASLPLDPSKDYRLFAIANSKGWFAAAALQKDGSSCVLLSPLEELRAAFKTAKDGSEELFNAKRVISLETSKPVALTFANNDTRLIIGFEQGQVLVYDAATILTAGTNAVTPIHVLNTTSAPIRQVCANPGSDAGHSDTIALVRGDGTVTLVNSSLEPQGGWQAGDESTTPVAVAWSPKGKHLAIGLKSGDILTYPLTNKETVYKHIPPTSEPPLTYLEWLGPGHVFRTVYSPAGSDALQHIICLDSKTNRAVYFAPNYPFALSDRERYQPISLYLPKWDEDAGSTESKSLLVVGDRTSVDLEVLGSTGTQWYQQSQENPLSLPLDKNQDDTILVSLEADLTNSSTSTPIMYAYLNDGTLQGWSLEHSKPYQGMITPGAASATTAATSTTTSAFGQTSFGATPTSTTSAFGSTSAFGQPSTFGSAAPAPTFGGSSFGQPSTTSAFGQPSGFGSSGTTSAFGASAAPATSAFGGSGSSFGSNTGGGFGAFAKPGGTATFGQPAFGFGAAPTTTTTTTSLAPPTAPDMTREESMADGTATPPAPAPAPAFGGLSLGGDSSSSDSAGKSGIFGSFGSSTSTAPSESTSAFGSPLKPATGFGAFGSFKPGSAFGGTSTETPSTTGSSAATPAGASNQLAFGQSSFGQSTFGKSSFGQSTTSAFGQSGFGQPSKFGQSSFGNPASTTTNAPSSGGFGSFASTPTSFSASAQQTSGSAFAATPSSTGGFSAFASSNASPFSLSVTAPQESGFGSKPSAFATDSSTSFAAPRNDTTSPFAATPATASTSPFAKPESPPAQKPSGLSTPQDSPPTTPIAQPSMDESDKEDSPTPAFSSTPAKSPGGAFGGAFGGLQASPSPFKPSTGFGAFGASTTPESSPFFKSKPQESTTPTLSAFSVNSASTTASTTPTAAPAFGASSSLGASAFGAKSTFGTFASPTPKSAFSPAASTTPTPAATPSSGGFSAFSGSSSTFTSSTSAQPKSFKDLLKSNKDDVPKSKSSDEIFSKKAEEESTTAPDAGKNQEQKPLTRQDTDESPVKQESSAASFENLSLLSQASSYADISHASEEEDALESGGETDEHVSDHDYLPEDESEEEESDVEEDSVLSGSEADYSRDIENSGDEEEVSEDPINVPLPPSRSGSQTPQKDVPVLQFTPSSSPSEQEGSILDTIPEEKEDTTTPPGTPIKQPTPVKAKAPPPTPPPPFGLGIGNKSTRPARSSPLASASVSSNDDEEPEKTPKRDQDAKAPSPFQLTLKSDEDQKTTRPKTPPLLGTVAPTKSDPFGSSSIPTKSAFGTPTPTQTPSSGFFGKPATATTASSTPFSQSQPQTTSFFGSPSIFSQPQTQPKPGLGAFSLPTAKQEEAPKPGFGAFSLPPAKQEEAPKPGLGAFSLATPKQEEAPKPFSGFSLPKAAEKAETKPTQPSLFEGLSFGKDASKQPLATPSAPATPSPAFGLGAFNLAPKPTERPASSPLPTTAAAGAPVVSTPTSVIKPEAKSPPAPTPEATLASMEIGMQRECASLVMFLQQELHNLAQVATKHLQIRTELSKSLGGSRHKADLGEAKKWGVADSEQFGHLLKQYEKDLDALKEQRATLRQSLKELQSSMLKAGTRKEEIARFNKAKTDKEFAKMLKARTLGPEHLETQTQLRRNIRTIKDRIQKLEGHLQTSKKKLAQVKSGKPMLRAPTLDTINRTYRNIDVAVQQQADDVSRLTKRVAKLNMGTPIKPSATHRDARLPDPLQVTHSPTPSYAIRSAAALNAERSAARLKRALLAVRKEPLLNTEAVGVAPTPDPSTGKMAITGATTSTLAITGAPPTPGLTPGLKLPASMPLFSTPTPAAQPPPPVAAPASDPAFDFSLPPDNFDPTHTPPSMRRGATGGAKKHTPAPVFKGSGQTGSPSSAPSFNWGPLPAFNASPETSKAGPSKFFSFTKPS